MRTKLNDEAGYLRNLYEAARRYNRMMNQMVPFYLPDPDKARPAPNYESMDSYVRRFTEAARQVYADMFPAGDIVIAKNPQPPLGHIEIITGPESYTFSQWTAGGNMFETKRQLRRRLESVTRSVNDLERENNNYGAELQKQRFRRDKQIDELRTRIAELEQEKLARSPLSKFSINEGTAQTGAHGYRYTVNNERIEFYVHGDKPGTYKIVAEYKASKVVSITRHD